MKKKEQILVLGSFPYYPFISNNGSFTGATTRVAIATQIAASLAASEKTFDDDSFLVKRAYKIADEIIYQSFAGEVQTET